LDHFEQLNKYKACDHGSSSSECRDYLACDQLGFKLRALVDALIPAAKK